MSIEAPPSVTPGVKPLTIVSKLTEISLDDMAQRVVTTREKHGDLLQQYHEAWYNSEHTWHYTHFLGVGLMKCPNDLWVYQDILTNHRPTTIIETGTYQGGSALWFAYLMDMLQIDGRVLTVDFEDHRRCDHPRITFLGGDSTDPLMAEAIAEQLPEDGPRLVVLDADHSAAHVYKELCLYAPLVRVGDWLVVEDTNIAWGDETASRGDRGAQGGLEDYLRQHPGEFRQDVLCERYLLTMSPGGWLQRIAPHQGRA
jgi:cephalosporin hydroxylase